MKEDFLYYVWKLQYFDKKNLITCRGDALSISDPGTRNVHAGPDFLKGSITINNVTWYGHIEMHINASDWYTHQHQTDKAYDNVILHVVWNYDRDIHRQDGTAIPTLVLKDRVAPQLHQQYQKLVLNKAFIPCANQLPHVAGITKTSMLEKALFQRLTNKNNLVYQLLEDNQSDWEETAYQFLAYNLGFKVNSSTFLELALSLPLKVLKKHTDNVLQLEALLLGQAGLLPDSKSVQDAYVEKLRQEYQYLVRKYQLKAGSIQESQWKFFQLRPANFPTIRIAQFAQLLHQHPSIFELLVNVPTKMLYKELSIVQSSYWQKHYQFYKESERKITGLGKTSIEHVLINTTVPLLVAYGKTKDEQDYVDRAIAILQYLPAEYNAITRHWNDVGIKAKNAFDSQALIELFNNFCAKKQCLSCHIGASVMQKATSP
ncbi:MAG: DUF2851 family protein [Amoebophilaceae bacterium]|jgi:hypothetical protein|nr:DUF2851 family protein [Amoebophilaceae bacterium]